MKRLAFSLLLLVPAALAAQREKFALDEVEIIEQKWPGIPRTQTGIRTRVLSPGLGNTPNPGDEVAVLYKGTLLDGTPFDESKDPQNPFRFRVSRREVIAGWDEILQLMRPGERRLAIIPAELAYGSRGRPPGIPRNAPLVFEIRLLSVRPPVLPDAVK
ncbi:MAG: FKBP-type peptidyl-prolyl cis-trans isomerase [Opitutaceae bacterium]|nr:FKBP-type peptidyl-prolyl cis-trans isomerase [Opitutaceae bacterium]